jgi:hypothetical protein
MTRRRHRYRATLTVLAALALPACASPTIWDKAGGTQAGFNQDSYRCQRESMTGVAYTGINSGYGFSTVIGQPTSDQGMYDMCMRAAGYTPRGG